MLAAAALFLVVGLAPGRAAAQAQPASERAATERAATERAATERAATERAATERAATERAVAFVRSIGDQAMALIKVGDASPGGPEAALRRLLQSGVDIPAISRAALGRHWDAATGAQRTEFRELFAKYVVANYARLLVTLGMQNFTVLGAEPSKAKHPAILVRTEAQLTGNQLLEWIWRVHETAQGYKIIDLATAGISLVAVQRDDFDAVVAAHGLDGLLAELRKRL